MTPNDPYFDRQWHLQAIGDLQTVWNEYRGGGVHVGVYDTGVDFANPDLAARHDPSRNVVVDGQTRDGAPTTSHGTAVAGLIAASGNNGTGVVGVAWEAGLTSINIYDESKPEYVVNIYDESNLEYMDTEAAPFFSVVRQATNFDVINNSWAPRLNFSPSDSLSNPDGFDSRLVAEFAHISAYGRDGLGTVVVEGAANNGGNVNAGGIRLSRHTVTVAATLEDGFATSYSNQGAAVLVTAPGSPGFGTIVTTDLAGSAGVNWGGANDSFDGTGNYRWNFNGTSAASPIVTGVVALMLDANPGLGWRDVQNILAASSTHTGSAIGAAAPATNENSLWVINGGDSWNGGGAHFSPDYGYGMVDAFNAVRMAEAWTYFSPIPEISANERSLDTGTITANATIPDNGAVTYTFTVTGSLAIEHVALEMRLTHPNLHQVHIFLVSPNGTAMRLSGGGDGGGDADRATDGWTWTFGADGLRGELAEGSWSVRIEDTVAGGGAGTLNWLRLVAYGSTPDADDVYHYTDELSDMVALSAARRSLADADGGTDWIDAAALHLASRIDLGAGAAMIDGVSLTVSGIENVLSGDGNDTLVGNAGANVLRGMRGGDSLTGAAGDDVLAGGAGADTLDGGEGQDTADYSGALPTGMPFTVAVFLRDQITAFGDAEGDVLIGIENLVGSAFGDLLLGDDNANRLEGGGGDDELDGFGGADTLLGGTGGDVMDGGDGVDTADYSSALLVSGNPFAVLVNLNVHTAGYGDAAGDDLRNIENLVGSAFADGLLGDDGVNRIDGGGGHDELYGYGGADTLVGGAGNDTLDGGDGLDTADYAANTEAQVLLANLATGVARDGQGGTDALRNIDAVAGGAGADRVVGNDVANLLAGNAGNDLLVGGAGDDTLAGGLGNDGLTGGDGLDWADFSAAGGGIVVTLLKTTQTIGADQGRDTLTDIENVIGSAFRDTLVGETGANLLRGGGGDDVLSGGDGNDTLDGGSGNDTLSGGLGDDSFIVVAVGDRLSDTGGTDTVIAWLDWTLAAGFETLALEGPAITGRGNAADNLISGTGAANVLSGLDGADTLEGGGGNDRLSGDLGADLMRGGAGDDFFSVDDAGDVAEGGDGFDVVSATISFVLGAGTEKLVLAGGAGIAGTGSAGGDAILGNAGANLLRGEAGVDDLRGGAGADTLIGGDGRDLLRGDAGADRFRYGAPADADGDLIYGFVTDEDRIEISASGFGGGLTAGAFASGAFESNLTGLAGGAGTRMTYETDLGRLWWDIDGSGTTARVLLAQLVDAPTFVSGDLLVIA